MPKDAPHSLSRMLVLLVVHSALISCHKGAGESGDAQAPAQAGSSAQPSGSVRGPRSIRLVPHGGVGFDDLLYSAESHAVLAPAGATGCVDLFDSGSLAKTARCGLSASSDYAGGHGEGVTSADIGSGWLFAVDRTSQSLKVAKLVNQQAARAHPLSGQPDYVRWVESTREVWVTEPDREQIEVFALDDAGTLTKKGAITVKDGPESLAIDRARGRAYSHTWSGGTVAIDLTTHALAEHFANGCKGSRGIALDSSKGFLFVGCSEGKALVLDIDHSGRVLGTQQTSSGVDIVSVNLDRNHLYVPAASDGSVAVLGVGANGSLTALGRLPAARGAHCVTSDDHSRVWVCSPDAGALLVFDDPFPPTRQ
jgi:DNA-binding beta-propeller fold protein YncE